MVKNFIGNMSPFLNTNCMCVYMCNTYGRIYVPSRRKKSGTTYYPSHSGGRRETLTILTSEIAKCFKYVLFL